MPKQALQPGEPRISYIFCNIHHYNLKRLDSVSTLLSTPAQHKLLFCARCLQLVLLQNPDTPELVVILTNA